MLRDLCWLPLQSFNNTDPYLRKIAIWNKSQIGQQLLKWIRNALIARGLNTSQHVSAWIIKLLKLLKINLAIKKTLIRSGMLKATRAMIHKYTNCWLVYEIEITIRGYNKPPRLPPYTRAVWSLQKRVSDKLSKVFAMFVSYQKPTSQRSCFWQLILRYKSFSRFYITPFLISFTNCCSQVQARLSSCDE